MSITAEDRVRAQETEDAGYPEHAKLERLGDERAHVQNFLDWLLDESGHDLAHYRESTERWYPSTESRPRLMARYFEIDPEKLDAEKRKMIAQIQKVHAK